MKRFYLVFFSILVCFLAFLVGLSTGFQARLVFDVSSSIQRTVRPDPNEDKCTCVPCLPDHWCKKCGHKSRDCPKLYRYFHPATNNVKGVSK